MTRVVYYRYNIHSITSAEYWFYDGRLGRRWNVAPVFKEYESPYACFSNNPIIYLDPKGDDEYYAPCGKLLMRTNDGDGVFISSITCLRYNIEVAMNCLNSEEIKQKNLLNFLKSNSSSIDKIDISIQEERIKVLNAITSIIKENDDDLGSNNRVKIGIVNTNGKYVGFSIDGIGLGTNDDNKKLHPLLNTKANIMCTIVHENEHIYRDAGYSFLFSDEETYKIAAKQELKAFYAEVSCKWWKKTTTDYKTDAIAVIEDYLNQAELNIAEEFANKFNEKIKGGKYIKQKDNSFKFQKDEVK